MNARTIRFALLVHALLFACFSPLAIAQTKSPGAQSSPGVKAAGKSDWREQYAYTLGMQAYKRRAMGRNFATLGRQVLEAGALRDGRMIDVSCRPESTDLHKSRSLERLEVNMETVTRTVVALGIGCSRFYAGDEL